MKQKNSLIVKRMSGNRIDFSVKNSDSDEDRLTVSFSDEKNMTQALKATMFVQRVAKYDGNINSALQDLAIALLLSGKTSISLEELFEMVDP